MCVSVLDSAVGETRTRDRTSSTLYGCKLSRGTVTVSRDLSTRSCCRKPPNISGNPSLSIPLYTQVYGELPQSDCVLLTILSAE